MAEQLLTISEVAKRLRCSVTLAYALCAEGNLPHLRIRHGWGTIRVQESDPERFLAGCWVTKAADDGGPLKRSRSPTGRRAASSRMFVSRRRGRSLLPYP